MVSKNLIENYSMIYLTRLKIQGFCKIPKNSRNFFQGLERFIKRTYPRISKNLMLINIYSHRFYKCLKT